MPKNAAAQVGNSYDYINTVKQHIYALDDSIKKCCRDSVMIQRELNKLPESNVNELTAKLKECANDTARLTSQLRNDSIMLDDITLSQAALNDSLEIKVIKCTNTLLNTPCNPLVIKSLASYSNYGSLNNNSQLHKNIKLLNNYERYSSQLLDIVTPVVETLDRNGWMPLANNSNVHKQFKDNLKKFKQKTYKDYGKENENIILLDQTINSLETLSSTNFANSKDALQTVIHNLTPHDTAIVSPLEMMDAYRMQIDSLSQRCSSASIQLTSKRQEIDKINQYIESNSYQQRLDLEQQLQAIHTKCDDMREKKDIVIFKECLFYNLKHPYNDTIINALKPFIKETYFKSYQDFLNPYLHILDKYGAYTDSLYSVMRYCYNTYCIRAHWEPLPSDCIADVRAKLKNTEYYKLYYQRKDKVNSPHLNSIMGEYIKLMDSKFAGCRTQYMELLTKLRGKKPKPKNKKTDNEPHDDDTNNSENKQ